MIPAGLMGLMNKRAGQWKNKKRASLSAQGASGNMEDDDTSNYRSSVDGGGKRVRGRVKMMAANESRKRVVAAAEKGWKRYAKSPRPYSCIGFGSLRYSQTIKKD